MYCCYIINNNTINWCFSFFSRTTTTSKITKYMYKLNIHTCSNIWGILFYPKSFQQETSSIPILEWTLKFVSLFYSFLGIATKNSLRSEARVARGQRIVFLTASRYCTLNGGAVLVVSSKFPRYSSFMSRTLKRNMNGLRALPVRYTPEGKWEGV